MLTHPRADSLPFIRDFIHAMIKGDILQLSHFNLVIPHWKRSRCYHYWSAIRDLGLARLDKKRIKVSSLGRRLSEAGAFGSFADPGHLNEEETNIFKTAFLEYEPVRSFLTHFVSNGKQFRRYEQLRRYGNAVIIEPSSTYKRGMVLITAKQERLELTPSEAYTIRWTLKSWCKQLGIMDEIWLVTDFSYRKYLEKRNIPERLFYPLKRNINNIEIKEFRKMLDNVIDVIGSNHIFIPILTYYFCTKYFVPIKEFHSKLIDFYHSDPYHYYLETGTIVGFNERYRRLRDYENYPRVDGYPRNYLIIRK